MIFSTIHNHTNWKIRILKTSGDKINTIKKQ